MSKALPGEREKDITRSIRNFLKVAGITHYKQWQGLGSEKGIPDIIIIEYGTGRYVGLEVKTATGRMSEHQLKWKRRIEAAGGRYILARSVADVIGALQATTQLRQAMQIDFNSKFYKNCRRQRNRKTSVCCSDCPFKQEIELQEAQGFSLRGAKITSAVVLDNKGVIGIKFEGGTCYE